MAEPYRLSPEMVSRRLQALHFIKGYFAEWGMSPSLGEIAEALSISRSRAHAIVRKLAKDGSIGLHGGRQRGITLPDPSDALSLQDALRKLRAAGYHIDDDVLRAAGPVTKATLTALPALDHIPVGGNGDQYDGATRKG